jgi:Choline/ethanolamine kinase
MEKAVCLILLAFIFQNSWALENTPENKIKYAFHKISSTIQTLVITPLVGGLSHDRKIFKCTLEEKNYVACILNAPFIQRKKEVEAHLLVMNMGRAPTIYYYNDDYTLVIMDFINDHTLSLEEGALSGVLDQISEACRQMSQLPVTYLPPKNIFAAIYAHCDQLIHQDTKLSPLIMQAQEKVKILEQKINQEQRSLVFCHGDLHPRNIFFSQQHLLIIDWEDAGLEYELFDLASFSVFFCLDDKADVYILTHYLQKIPTRKEKGYFQWLKLAVRAADAFGIYASLEDLNVYASHEIESVNEFLYYQTLFAKNEKAASSPKFLYEMACSQLQEFFKTIERALEY